jgi:hypothetical protein
MNRAPKSEAMIISKSRVIICFSTVGYREVNDKMAALELPKFANVQDFQTFQPAVWEYYLQLPNGADKLQTDKEEVLRKMGYFNIYQDIFYCTDPFGAVYYISSRDLTGGLHRLPHSETM